MICMHQLLRTSDIALRTGVYGVGQGTIRENLDPMGRHSDRELIGVLKATRLWDILCGV